ncbi:hypothetical protein H311_04484, partial [Anncaliia algerae PRA109]
RGLDYYTGIIFEAVFDSYKELGSVAGGGRYDNLVSSILPQNSSLNVPCIGFSFGLTRILPLMLKNTEIKNISNIKVYVTSSGSLLLEERMKVLRELWGNKIASETFYTNKFNFNNALEHVQKNDIPYLLVLGENELKMGKYKLLYGEQKKEKLEDSLNYFIIIYKKIKYFTYFFK